MILNNSRTEAYNACKELAYNQEVRHLAANRTAQPLLVGSGFHAGLAVINSKSGTLDEAAELGAQCYRDRANWPDLLKEERTIAEKDILLVRNMIKAYGENYLNEKYEVLAPEVSFRVPLPQTEHHCWYFHQLLVKLGHTEVPFDQCSEEIPHTRGKLQCWQPHWLVGTSDAVIQWNRAVWLLEHKTTAYDLYNDSPQSKNWILNWQLATQASCYIYGIWKSTKILPHGVLLNVVIKPRSNAANPVFSFYREGFLRTTEHLQSYETEVSRLADDYEYRMRTGLVWKNPHSCFNYARRCDFHKSCVSGEPGTVGQGYVERNSDYVNAAYYKVLGLEPPAHQEEEPHDLSGQ